MANIHKLDPKHMPMKALVQSATVKARFEEVLKNRAPQFLSSLVSVVNDNRALQNVDQTSVLNAAMTAASFDLPVNPNLGYFYIIPYGSTAQAQMGYKGYIQLAQRSGQYKRLNAVPVYEDEFGGWNPLTEELTYTPHFKDRDANDKPTGYVGFFQLVNGFEKTVYWSRQQIDNHRKRFSKSGGKNEPKGVWASDFDAMALKTVIRNLITKWGPMTVDIQKATDADEESFGGNSEPVKDVTPHNMEDLLDKPADPTEPLRKEAKQDALKPDITNDPNEEIGQPEIPGEEIGGDDDLPAF